MQEIRCQNQQCNKIIAKVKYKKDKFIVMSESKETVENILNAYNDCTEVEIQCPHNYRNESGKNVQCKTLNKVII